MLQPYHDDFKRSGAGPKKEMAEIAVSYAVSSIINKLEPLLCQGPVLLREVQVFFDIKDGLRAIQPLLKDSEYKVKVEGNELGSWLRELAHKIEDIIDEYTLMYLANQQSCFYPSFVKKVVYLVFRPDAQRKMVSEIHNIKRSIDELREVGKMFGLLRSSEIGSSSATKAGEFADPRVISSLVNVEDKLVGVEAPRDELISRLVKGESGRTFISIVGTSGIGKTTLASIVYDNAMVVKHFDCRAWIHVSESFNIGKILSSMIKQLFHKEKRMVDAPEGTDGMKQNKLRDSLHLKRYLVVFDDVWNIEFLEVIQQALPDYNTGSRVIFTTCNSAVGACFGGFHPVMVLQPLPREKSWELFCMKALLSEFERHFYEELELLFLEIVKRCEGSPFKILVIGGLLSTKNISEWQDFYNKAVFKHHLSVSMNSLLMISYDDLPPYLKCCFLYLGMLPKNYTILCERLIRLWIAEGFIETQRGKTLEENAEGYLAELIRRSLVQVSQVDFEGKITACRVHNLVHYFIRSKSDDFGQVVGNVYLISEGHHVPKGIRNALIRTVFLFEENVVLPKSLLCTLVSTFKLLKVLDLEDALVADLPAEVGNLFPLRYLSVKNTKVKILPKSIGNLHNLQTLDVIKSCVHELPVEINRLHKLRHLLAYNFNTEVDLGLDSIRGVRIKTNISRLGELQSLYYVDANSTGAGLMQDLKCLRQLRKLGIKKLTKENGRALSISIEKLEYLKSLEVSAISKEESLDLDSISSPPQSLKRLYLSGHLEKLPNWILKLHNLVRLRLFWSGFNNDPLKSLQSLPNLLWLGLYQVYEGESLYFEAGGFQKLKLLLLRAFNRLNSVIIEEGALPLLEKLTIGPCPQLRKVPSGIHHLHKLQTLDFYAIPKEFEDDWIVEHVPVVRFHNVEA